MSAAALVIAAQNLMPALRDRVKVDGEILTFADTEPIQALQMIMEQRPGLVVLERLFAATPRPRRGEGGVLRPGGATRAKAGTPRPAGAPPGATPAPPAPPPQTSGSPVPPEDAPKALDWPGTRRAPRFRVKAGVELHLDGNPAAVIDLSTVGAQVISPTVLRPNQKVRITIPVDDLTMRFRGAVAWAKFELPRPPAKAPQYRAGVEFTDADAQAIDNFTNRNKT